MDNILCDKCGKNMQSASGCTVIGVAISFKHSIEAESEHIKKQFGKYAEKNNWNFCYECWLDSLMGK